MLKALKNMVAHECLVVRGGEVSKVSAADLVPGDVVELVTGDVVPADMRIVLASNMKLNTSMLTGESEPVRVTTAVVPPGSTASLLDVSAACGFHGRCWVSDRGAVKTGGVVAGRGWWGTSVVGNSRSPAS